MSPKADKAYAILLWKKYRDQAGKDAAQQFKDQFNVVKIRDMDATKLSHFIYTVKGLLQ